MTTTRIDLPTLTQVTADLATALEGAILESLPGAMTSEEARAVGERVARGEGLPEDIGRRLGGSPVCTLISFDADRIQQWVFASERVQVAAGASKVLDDLNRDVREGEIVRDLQRRHGGRGLRGVLYSAGGGGLLVADTHRSEAELEEEVQQWLEERAHGLTFTVVARRLIPRDLERTSTATPRTTESHPLHRFVLLDGLAGALSRLQIEVRRQKEEPTGFPSRPPFQPKPGQALDRCPSCGRRPPEKTPVVADDPSRWCSQCQDLRRYWRRHGEISFEREGRPITFEDLAASSPRGRRYLSFLAVDGNSMGAVVQGVRTLVELRAFSEATTRIYQVARNRATESLAGYLSKDWSPEEAHLSLLSGGDEITLVLPASAAPEITVEILGTLEAGFDQATAPGGLLAEAFATDPEGLKRLRNAGAGAGLIAAQSSFPVRLLRHYAGDLQKRAKRRCGLDDLRSAVGWLLLTDSSPLPEGVSRQHDSEVSVPELRRLLSEVRAAGEAGLPRSALQRIVDHGRREEKSISTLSPGAERDEVLGTLMANFFRYQLARHPALRRWWEAIEPPATDGGGDAVAHWLSEGGVSRLERLLELWSLDPIPEKTAEPLEVTA
jgi:hypothetical protein